MKRKQFILTALAILLAIAAGIIWWWQSRPGLSAPIELVDIPPGVFLMGDLEGEDWLGDAAYQHQVRITYAFKMGKYEVTQKQWRELMGTTVLQQYDNEHGDPTFSTSFTERIKEMVMGFKDNPSRELRAIHYVGVRRTLKYLADGKWRSSYAGKGEGNNYPMYYVSWNEAVQFCARLTEQERAVGRLPAGMVYRLPTEAEWEYACRAGSTTRFANGNTEADLNQIGWYEENSGGTAHPVGKKLPNVWGLYDMHGNVSEWCHDIYEGYPTASVVNPTGPAAVEGDEPRVTRGGCWLVDERDCRSTNRDGGDATAYIGFRIVLGPPIEELKAKSPPAP